MCYVCFVLNHTHNATIKNIPLNSTTGSTCDISPFLRFNFWEPALFNTGDTNFPSDALEERGRFVGIIENVGRDMTFKILNSSTNKIINRSNGRPVNGDKSPNLRANPLTSPEVMKSLIGDKFNAGEEPHDYEASSNERYLPSSSKSSIPLVEPNDLVGRTFFLEKEGRQRLRVRIVKSLDDFEVYLSRDSSRLKFFCAINDDTIE